MNPLSLIPLKGWLYIGLGVALIAGYAYWHHHVYEQGVASMQAKVHAATLRATNAESLNHGAAATIANVQMSLSQCETDRITEKTAAALALADHDKTAALIHAQLLADKAKVQDLFNKALNPTCSEWAKQAACTP